MVASSAMRIAIMILLVSLVSATNCHDDVRDAGCEADCLATGFCYEDSDCAVDKICFDDPCARSSGCKDNDASTACPTDCIGTCASPVLAGFCTNDDECQALVKSDEPVTCRFDERICLRDRRVGAQVDSCVGWCVGACFLVITYAIDPDTGACLTFQDSCTPPGFATANANDEC